jgi:hypothetical protein
VPSYSFIEAFLPEYSEGCSEAALQVLPLLEFVVKGGRTEEVSCSLLLEVLLDGEASASGMAIYIVCGLGYGGLVVFHFDSMKSTLQMESGYFCSVLDILYCRGWSLFIHLPVQGILGSPFCC